MFANRPKVDALLRQVFSQEPIRELDSYVASAFLDVRRAIAGDSIVSEVSLVDAMRLPEWLDSPTMLTPWEADLLAMLFVGDPVLVIQGGSGCGKTSVLQHLKQYCQQWAREREQNARGLICRTPLLTVDLQAEAEDLKNICQDEQARAAQLTSFLQRFGELLDTALAGLAGEVVATAIGRAFLSEWSDRSSVTRMIKVRETLGEAFRRSHPGDPPTLARLIPLLAILGSEHDRVIARYLVIQELARLQMDAQNVPLCLVIDNIDPFPEYLQNDLIRTLEAIAYSRPTSGGRPQALSIGLLVRFSTSARQSGALDGVRAVPVSFRCPDPADLVFFRLTSLLMEPTRYPRWKTLGHQDQEEVLARAWFMWERLGSAQGQFSRVLSGLAGTNGRTGCKLARWWLTAKRWDGVRMAGNHARPRIDGALAIVMLLRLAEAVGRALREGPEAVTRDCFATIVTDRFFFRLRGIMVGHHLVRRAERPSLAQTGARSRSADVARRTILEMLADLNGNSLVEVSAPLAGVADELVRGAGIALAERIGLAAEVKACLEQRETELRAKLQLVVEGDRQLAERACAWLVAAVVRGVRGDTAPVDVGAVVRRAVPELSRSVNRWEAISVLISPDSETERTGHSAVNVFSATGETICPVALHVLCDLQEAGERREGDGLNGLVLKDRLHRWQFRDEEWKPALSDMVNVDRRLVYSNVKDEAEGLESWFDAYHTVYISSAGSGYLNWVVTTPAYLQWALLEIPVVVELLGGREEVNRERRTALGRMKLVLDGLEIVRTDEIERARKLPQKAGLDSRRSLSPLGWVFVGSLRRFILDLSGQGAPNSDARREAERLARGFLQFGKSLRRSHEVVFGASRFPVEWDYRMAGAEQEYAERFDRR